MRPGPLLHQSRRESAGSRRGPSIRRTAAGLSGVTGCVAVMALISLGMAAPAHATGYIEIDPPGPDYGHTLDLSELPNGQGPDVVNRTYTNITTSDGTTTNVTATGYSLALALSDLGIPANSFNVAEVYEPKGPSLLLDNAQASTQTGFPDGPPLVWEVASGTELLVPSSAGSPGQTIVEDTIGVKLHSGALLDVQISASATKAGPAKSIRFRATVTGALAGESLDYRWNFDDGTGAATLDAKHSYAISGTYDVYLRVSGSDDSIGYSTVLPITIGKAPKGPNRTGGGTSTHKHAPTSGAGVKSSTPSGTSTDKQAPSSPAKTQSAGPATSSNRTGTSAKPSAPSSRRIVTTIPKPATKPARSSRAPAQTHPAHPAPLVSGIALSNARDLPPTTSPGSTHPGVSEPSRTGHLLTAPNSTRVAFSITLGALAALLGGAALEWIGPQRMLVRFQLGRRKEPS